MDDFLDIDFDFNATEPCVHHGNCTDGPLIFGPSSVIGLRHIVILVCYGLVFLVGVPGNALVAWVTAFRMPRSVNALWFLNLSVADLLCCLSLPLQMVAVAWDDHWPYGALGCRVLTGLLYLVMYCSVLLLVVISLDRWLLVRLPIWCQNWRQPWLARWVCVVVWALALLEAVPHFLLMEEIRPSKSKVECRANYSSLASAWATYIARFLLGFFLPFLVICYSHWTVYQRAGGGSRVRSTDRLARTRRVILAVVLSFFLCWLPLHMVDLVFLLRPNVLDSARANLHLMHRLAICVAYINSCLNPLLYVCLGRGFKASVTRTLRSLLHYASEEPPRGLSMTGQTKSTTDNSTLGRASI